MCVHIITQTHIHWQTLTPETHHVKASVTVVGDNVWSVWSAQSCRRRSAFVVGLSHTTNTPACSSPPHHLADRQMHKEASKQGRMLTRLTIYKSLYYLYNICIYTSAALSSRCQLSDPEWTSGQPNDLEFFLAITITHGWFWSFRFCHR